MGWKSWQIQSWNERLIDHFFRSDDEQASPVAVLLVTAEELARVTGDPTANPDEARDAFVQAVRSGIFRSKSLLEDASDYQGWPNRPPRREHLPRFLAHLLFTCIAASESSEELGDEGSFVSRLRELTDNQLPEHSLGMLPRLWGHLATWLKANEGRYRRLILPDPGGYTRIGHTIKLAFPDRRDQRRLSELLDSAGLSGHEPPVGRVLSLIGAQRQSFRPAFRDAYDEFRRMFEGTHGDSTSQLVNHRFWAAVREASFRGRGRTGTTNAAVRLSLLGDEDEGRLMLYAVTDEAPVGADFPFAELPRSYGPWRFAVVPESSQTLDGTQIEHVVQAMLNGSLRLPMLSSYVDQGLIPFVSAPHGLFELARQGQLGEVTIALVRKDLLTDFLRVTENQQTSVVSSCYPGWVQVHEPNLPTVPSAELEKTSLRRMWILQEVLAPISIRLVDGIRADDGWLGACEVLPRIVAPGASAVHLETADKGDVPLISLGDGVWAFPPRDLAGEYTLVVSDDDGDNRRVLRFHQAPASEAFKPAAEPSAWIVEEVGRTGTLSSRTPFADAPADEDYAAFWERAAFLGRDVGEFVTSADQAAWKVVHFTGKLFGTRGGLSGDDGVPSRQVSNPKARRRWRKLLFESTPDSSSCPQFAHARQIVKAGAWAHTRLPQVDLDQSIPTLTPLRPTFPSEAVGRLIRIVASRAAARSGIPWSEWFDLTKRVLKAEGALQQFVTRAWMEAGLIDVVSFARWRYGAVFVRPPHLVTFKSGEILGGTLAGLALPTTIEEVRRTAARLGVLVEERSSISSFVPWTLSFRAADRRAVEALASACRLGLQWLNLARLEHEGSNRHDGTSPPPGHYEWSTRWSRWSLKAGEYPDLIFEQNTRRDCPNYWTVSRDGRSVWFYDLNLARAWAAALLDEPVVRPVEEAFIDVNHAFLPLPLARALSVLGAGLPGPVGGTYRYPVGNLQLRDFAFDLVSRTFDPSRLAAPAAERATG